MSLREHFPQQSPRVFCLQDVERGEVYPAVGVSSSSHSQPAAAALASLPTPTPMPNPVSAFVATPTSLHASSAVTTVAGSRYDARTTTGGVGQEVNVLPADAQDLSNARTGVTTSAAATVTRSRKDQSARSNRWRAVGCVLRRLALVMLLLAALTGALAVLVIYMGPIYLVQLLVVISVAYFVAGGRLRWFYVAFKTLPRDIKWVGILNEHISHLNVCSLSHALRSDFWCLISPASTWVLKDQIKVWFQWDRASIIWI